MMNWRHKGFVKRTVHRAATRYEPGHEPLVYDSAHEGWTTKQCECGYVNHNIGGAKEYTCPKCGRRIARDGSAAKVALIKYTSVVEPQQRPAKKQKVPSASASVSASASASAKRRRRV